MPSWVKGVVQVKTQGMSDSVTEVEISRFRYGNVAQTHREITHDIEIVSVSNNHQRVELVAGTGNCVVVMNF